MDRGYIREQNRLISALVTPDGGVGGQTISKKCGTHSANIVEEHTERTGRASRSRELSRGDSREAKSEPATRSSGDACAGGWNGRHGGGEAARRMRQNFGCSNDSRPASGGTWVCGFAIKFVDRGLKTGGWGWVGGERAGTAQRK